MKVPCHCTRPRFHHPSRPSPSAARHTPPHPTHSVHMYIMLALWIHHQEAIIHQKKHAGATHKTNTAEPGPPTRATPRGQQRQENQAKPRAQENPVPKPARPHLPLYTRKGLMHKAYSFFIGAGFQEGSQEAYSKEATPRTIR